MGVDVTDRESVRIQIASWIAIAALLLSCSLLLFQMNRDHGFLVSCLAGPPGFQDSAYS